jgi:hypothetical protein
MVDEKDEFISEKKDVIYLGHIKIACWKAE